MAKINYETETCTRCAGSGHFSYNRMTGTRCFKCGGEKITYTKRGAAALAFAKSLANRKVETICIGEVVLFGNGGRLTVVSTAIEKSGVSTKNQETGEWVPMMQINLTGPKFTKSFYVGDTVRVPLTTAQADEVIAYQENLTKAGKPRKQKAAA